MRVALVTAKAKVLDERDDTLLVELERDPELPIGIGTALNLSWVQAFPDNPVDDELATR